MDHQVEVMKFIYQDKRYKIGVINLIECIYAKTEDVFKTAKEICNKIKLKKNVDFLVVDFHGDNQRKDGNRTFLTTSLLV